MMAGAQRQSGLVLPDEIAITQTASPAGVSTRFTLDGNKVLETHLELACARVLSGIRGLIPEQRLEAVLLGGGYGRGEGGVLRTPDGDRPYNDLEFYVAIKGNRHLNEFLYQQRLHVLGEILTQLVGIEVEFKITSLHEIANRPISMFSYDLIVGHRLLWSAESADVSAAFTHHRQADKIPAEEATRLLMNRCSGLLLARQKLDRQPFTPAAADFVRRNIAKVQLAMGDALLTVSGLYHSSCVERHRRLLQSGISTDTMPWFADVVRHHAAGVEFKLHPELSVQAYDPLAKLHAEVSALALRCWLWVESRRLNRPFATAESYALDRADKIPSSWGPRNLLLNFRVEGLRAFLNGSSLRHPRQRIFRTLPLLLWDSSPLNDPRKQQLIESALNAKASDLNQAMSAYSRVWARLQ